MTGPGTRGEDSLLVLFVCVSNLGRSPFAEYMLRAMVSGMEPGLSQWIEVASAGFVPEAVKRRSAELGDAMPDPFYGRPMPEVTRVALAEKGITVPPDWKSREAGPELLHRADVIVTALREQKEDLAGLYPDIGDRIHTMREMARWEGYLFHEDFSVLPRNGKIWKLVEEDRGYVSRILAETEDILIRAFPHIFKALGVRMDEARREADG